MNNCLYISNSAHKALKLDLGVQADTVHYLNYQCCGFSYVTQHCWLSLWINRAESCVSLSGQYILLYVCLLAAAPGGRRLRPMGLPQHPGTSRLADAAPVVRMKKAYAWTRAAVTWDRMLAVGSNIWTHWIFIKFGTFKLFLETCCALCCCCVFEGSLKALKSTSWQDTVCEAVSLNYLNCTFFGIS